METMTRRAALAALGFGLATGLLAGAVAPATAAGPPAASTASTEHCAAGVSSQPRQWVRGVGGDVINDSAQAVAVTWVSTEGYQGNATLAPGEKLSARSDWSHGFRLPGITGTLRFANGDVAYFHMFNEYTARPFVGVSTFDPVTRESPKDLWIKKNAHLYTHHTQTLEVDGHTYQAARSPDDSSNKNLSLRVLS